MKLYLDNMISKKWSMSNKEIIDTFKESSLYKNKEELKYIGAERMLRRFIGSPAEDEGLNSSFEPEDFENLFRDFLVSEVEIN